MSITSEITRINNNIADAYTSVGNKGGTLPQVQNSANLSSAIDSIPSGGGGGSAESNDVNFYDYDGTIVHSYSASEFAELTTMPENPTHQGLTAQGWNWSLADAKEYVAEYGMLDVGQMYVTDDGKTRIYITLEEGRLEPYLGFAINGTATVDWGDGNTEQVTGTGTSRIIYTQHSYIQAGDYVITIESQTSIIIQGDSTVFSKIISKNSNANKEDRVYQNSITKIELGNNVATLGSYAFQYCSGLKSITIPVSVTSIGNNAFSGCYALMNAIIPTNVTSIESSVFNNCYALANITIPANVTSIGNNAFSGCSSLTSITIPSEVTRIGNSVFYTCYALQNIIVPSSVTSIGNNTFQNCYALKSIAIPLGMTKIENYLFQSCYSLVDVIIPSNITSIGNYALYSCYALASITIPSSVTSIGSNAFSSCYVLQKVTMPSGVSSIAGSTFSNCSGVLYYDFTNCISVPTLQNTNAFSSIASDCQIIVPDALYEDWIVATNWSTYSSYIVKESEA